MVTDTTAFSTQLQGTSIAEFRSRLRGELILPADERYDEARTVWQAKADRHPALIVRCADVIDVIAAVRYAREHNLTVAVRSGGHSMSGQGTVDGGMVIDMSLMKAMSIDPVRRVAWAQPGLTWAEYAAKAQEHGLATTSGDVGTVGVGGLLLGGGIGWMVRKHGLTIDHLLSVEVVTAEGQLLRASATENAELFWALRGGGGNFGIVTAYELQLKPAGMVLGGAVIYPIENAERVVRTVTDYVDQAPDELTVICFIMPAPPAPFIPEAEIGKPVIVVGVCYTGDLAEGERVVAPLRSLDTPVAHIIGPMPYPAMFALTEAASARGFRHAIRSTYMDELNDEVITAIAGHSRAMAEPMCMVQIRILGGAMARVGREETAFAHRDKRFMVSAISMGDATTAEHQKAWVESFYRAVRPHAEGVYVNFLGDEGEQRVREAYAERTHRRLTEIKRQYDPENFFRMNQNIRP